MDIITNNDNNTRRHSNNLLRDSNSTYPGCLDKTFISSRLFSFSNNESLSFDDFNLPRNLSLIFSNDNSLIRYRSRSSGKLIKFHI